MKEIMQQTLAAPIAYSGIGLHSGKEVAMKLLPGKENTVLFLYVQILPGAAWKYRL